MSNVQWFYADAQQQQEGPVTFAEIQRLAASGEIQPSDLVWNEGMAKWTAASQVSGVFNAGPPPISAATVSSPYSASSSGFAGPVSIGGVYPVPCVKKSSFGLFLSLYLLSVVLIVAGFLILIAQSADTFSNLANESSQRIETREDLANFEAEQSAEFDRQIEGTFFEKTPILAISLIVTGIICSTISWILGLIALYRAWCVVQPGGARTTPGKAIGFLFIPLFNIYWTFEAYHGWSQDWNRIQASHGNLANFPRVSSGLFLTTLILGICSIIAMFVPFLNLVFIIFLPILFLIMFAQIYRVVNTAAAATQAR